MPTYEITAPNGKKYRIPGPAGATDEQIRAQVLKQFPEAENSDALANAAPAVAPSNSIPAQAVDMAQSAAAGFGRGVGNVALTAQDWLGKGLTAVGGGDVGGNWLQQNAQQGQANLNREFAPYQQRAPYSAGAGKIVGEVIGTGPAVKAVSGVANAARMPNVAKSIASGGMEAPNAFLRAVGGGITGATQSLLTQPEDTGLGTVVGALIPSAVAPAVNKFAKKVAEKAVPLTHELKSSAKKLYQDMDASGVRILQPVVQGFSSAMDNFVTGTQQYLSHSHPAVNAALKQLNDFANEPLSITRLNTYYKDLRKSAARIGGSEGSVLSAMADKVGALFDNLSPRELGGASARDVVNLRAANDLQQRAFKSEVIDDIIHKATIKGEGEASTVSTATAIQRGFRDLAANKAKMKNFSPEERAVIEKVAKGTMGTKITDLLSRMKPAQKLDARVLLYALGHTAAGIPGAAGVAGVGMGADVWRNAMVKGQAKNAGMLIRNKGPVTPSVRFPYPITRAGVSAAQQTKSNR
jgi:hypothetical protein